MSTVLCFLQIYCETVLGWELLHCQNKQFCCWLLKHEEKAPIQ